MIKYYLIKSLIISFLIVYIHFNVFSQNDLKGQIQSGYTDLTEKKLVNSPNTASFTQYGKIPVSQFTGQAQIIIPFYDIKVDNIDLPVYLTYNTRGIQPNSHAGWVGTGWSLVADAVITRKINGVADELIAPYDYTCGCAQFYGPYNFKNSFKEGDKLGWYYSCTNHTNSINTTDWYSVSALTQNYPGIISVDGKAIVIDAAADEFDFSVNGLSGAFFMGEDGNWKVRSKDAQSIQVSTKIGSYNFYTFPGNNVFQTSIQSTFLEFTLTAGDGTKYVFGDDPALSTTSNAIEFNRAGVRYNDNINTVATAWHIRQIILPSGKIIDYEYKRDGNQYVYNPSSTYSVSDIEYTTYGSNVPVGYKNSAVSVPQDANMNITDPVYLKSITFPEGALIFNSVPSIEMDVLDDPISNFNVNSTTPSNMPGQDIAHNIYGAYNELIIPAGNDYAYLQNLKTTNPDRNLNPSNWYKLLDIELDDYNKTKLKDIKLTYSSDVNTRMFLQSVQTFSYLNNAPGVSLPPYTFYYNTTPLPKYCTFNVDHWGFYNGARSQPYVNTDPIFEQSYNTFRSPEFSYTQAGILTQINYPTGGFSKFQYEANQYNAYVGNYPISVVPVTMTVGPGLRVKNIVTQDNVNSNQITYEYSYVNDLASGTGSGILGAMPPKYLASDNRLTLYNSLGYSNLNFSTISYLLFSNHSIYPASSDDANLVSYTTVIERQSANGIYNGMTVTNFTNHDNGYDDKSPDGLFTIIPEDNQLCNYNDRSFERGAVLSESHFDNVNNPVKIIQNTYNNDPLRFNQYVKSIMSSVKLIPNSIELIRLSAVRNYTFFPYLQQTTETDYSSDHSGNTVAKTISYFYDPVNTSISTNSSYLWLQNNSTNTYLNTFTVSGSGTTNLQASFIADTEPNVTAQVTATITGPNNYNATEVVCVATGTSGCSTWSIPNLPPGTYNLAAQISSQTQSLMPNVQVVITYPVSIVNLRTKNLVKTILSDSKGQSVISNIKYPLDYNFTGITPSDPFAIGINNLQSSNYYAVSLPVESTTQLSNADGSNLRTTASTLKSFDATFPIPNLIYKTSTITPVNNFVSSSISPFGSLVDDPSYEPRVYIDNFDVSGNPLQEHKANGPNQAFQWGYKNNYLVAVAKNASNTLKTTTAVSQSTGTTYFRLTNGSTTTYTTTFTVAGNGITSLQLGFISDPGNSQAQVSVSLSGPNSYYTTIPLCIAGGTANCGIYNSNWTATNLAPGTYTLTGYFYQSQNLTSDVQLSASFPNTTSSITETGVNDIFYDSFEEGDGNSVVNDSKTGHFSYTGSSGNYTKALNNLDPGTYTLSYWLRSNNGSWSFVINTAVAVAGSSYTIGISGQIDDVRFYPSAAQMTTYTYDPLVGMTSMADAKSDITYYEYDSFQRLINIKDHLGNIVKSYCYNYTGQTTGCSVPAPPPNPPASIIPPPPTVFQSDAQPGSFTKSDCDANSTGTTVPYTVPQGMFTSTISREDANQQAIAYLNAQGPINANTLGSCTPNAAPNVMINLNNTTNSGYQVVLTNSTSNYKFTFNNNGIVLPTPTVVAGTYDISVYPINISGPEVPHTIELTGQPDWVVAEHTYTGYVVAPGPLITILVY